MNILIINGPNINLLGKREPEIYGHMDYVRLMDRVRAFATEKGVSVKIEQSNHEGMIIDIIHAAPGEFDAIVINPGAYTHYSYAIYDAIKAVGLPAIEVHFTNIHNRDEFRRKSVIAPACVGQIAGLGVRGYELAISYFLGEG